MGFIVLRLIACCSTLLLPVSSEEWTHSTVLDGNGKYHLSWQPPEDKRADSEIVFQVEVQAKGFVGFGLSPNGGMAGSDIVTGWIKNGQAYFQDRHGIGKTLPPKDDKQDWTLLAARENDTHTIFKFSRKLDTCDENDIVIDDSTMRLIFAYSDEDPRFGDPFYHYGNRGIKSAMLLQTKTAKKQQIEDSSLLHWDVKSPDFDISPHKSIYWCKIFKSPQLMNKHHIVQVKPLIQEGHEEFVHHMVLYECVGATDDEYADYLDFVGHACFHPNMPDVMKRCEGVTLAWAVGGDDLLFPEHVGLPIESAPGKYYMLEVHYDNPMRRQGIRDSSGLRLYYTPNLRMYDAGCLMLGSTVTPRMFIPPGQKAYEVVGHTNPECLGPEMASEGIKVLGVLLHAHLLGRGLKVRHFRDGKELAPLAVEDNYDFNYQEYRYFKEEIVILPTDQITVECTYDSTKKDKVTFGGISTEEEMCLAFLLYYPKINRYASQSIPRFSTINKLLNTSLTNMRSVYSLWNYDWNQVNVSHVADELRNSEHDSHCYFGDGEKDAITSLISYPKDFQPYVPADSTCKKDTLLYSNDDDESDIKPYLSFKKFFGDSYKRIANIIKRMIS